MQISDKAKLDYLNLEIPIQKIIRVKDKEIGCFETGYQHDFHTSNSQLNMVCDIGLSVLHNLNTVHNQLFSLSKLCSKHFIELENTQKEFKNYNKLEKKLSSIIEEQKNIKEEIRSISSKRTDLSTERLEIELKEVKTLVERLNKFLI